MCCFGQWRIYHNGGRPPKIRDASKHMNSSEIEVQVAGIQLEKQVETLERSLITSALKEAKGNKTQAAKLLNISFRSLRYRLEKLDMDDGED